MKVEEFKRYLFNQKYNKRDLLVSLKYSDNINDIRKVFKAFSNHPLLRAMVFKPDKPLEINNLQEFRPVGYTKSIEKELNWTISVLELYKDEINSFIKAKIDYENAFLNDDFELAESLLDAIAIEFGPSIWLLENYLLLKEYKIGVKDNWSLLSEYSKNISNPYILFFLEKLSKRAEKNISYFRYKNLFNNIVNDVGIPNIFNEYLCFKFSYFSFIGYGNFDYYLWLENQFPVLDRYNTLIDIMVELAVHHSASDTEHFSSVINDLNKCFDDVRLKQICNLTSNQLLVFPDTEDALVIFDHYGKTDYSFCVKNIPNLINKNPQLIELYEVYIKSLIELKADFVPIGKSEIIDSILENLYNLYIRNGNNEEAVETLLKIIQSFNSTIWAKKLLGLVANKINLSPTINNYLDYSFLNSFINNPKAISSAADSKRFYKIFKDNFSTSLSVKIQGYICSEMVDRKEILDTKLFIYEGRKLIRNKEFLDATSHYEKVLINEMPTNSYYEEIILNLYECYTETHNLNKALKLYCDNFLKNKYLISSMDPSKLLDVLEKTDTIHLSENIELPIFYNIVNADFYSQYVAYDSFLSYLNVDRPTDILDFNSFNYKAAIFFLKNVCKSDVMHYSLSFESSDEIENERINVCRQLLKIDPDNEQEYLDEIAEITQQSSIRNAIREVNKGRITVNINQLKSAEASNIKESFSRFRELASFSRNRDLVTIDSTSEILKNYLSSYENENDLLDKVVFTNDPAFITFKIMFLEIRDKFILSKEYGLDGYLSTRIRHGTLKNHIRSLFESLNLITQKDISGNYVENSYWSNKTNNEFFNHNLQSALKVFSKEIDELAEYIIKELIQVKTERFQDKINAWFDYSFSQNALGGIFNHIRDANFKDYNEFLDLITNILVERTDENLRNIREEFKGEITEKFHFIISQLQNSLKLIDTDRVLPELLSSILKSNTDIQQELENIAEWFNLTEQSSNLILNNETIIKTAIEITNSIYPNNKLYPEINDTTELYLPGQYCSQLIYINRILLDNIITHSGLSSDDLKVEITAHLDDEAKKDKNVYSTVLNLSYSNNLNLAVNQENLLAKLHVLKSRFNDPESKFENINFEGGSGFEKIKKILSIDLNMKEYNLDFIVSDFIIYVKLSMKIAFKKVEDE